MFTIDGIRFQKAATGDVTIDQQEYTTALRSIVSPELTGAAPDKEATQHISSLFYDLRASLKYLTLTQAWIQVYVEALYRVRVPTNLDVRRLNAVVRKSQRKPPPLTFLAMKCDRDVDLHTDSGYRRMIAVDDKEGYGMRGMCLMRRGTRPDHKGKAIHLVDSVCRAHIYIIRSSYTAEALASAHGVEDAFPTIVLLEELVEGPISPKASQQLMLTGGLKLKVTLTTDAESVFKSLSSRDLKTPSERTLLGHISWMRHVMMTGFIRLLQWCDTRDMVADGHTKGSIDRQLLLDAMSGRQTYQQEKKEYEPYRGEKLKKRVTFNE